MISKEQVEENFRKDFSDLLKKYKAEFDINVEILEYGPDISGISVYIPAEYVNEELVKEGITINFTKWFDFAL